MSEALPRQRDPIRLRPGRELEHSKGLCAAAHGFSLHAATTARADDAVGREALCKYILRPPVAQQNIQLQSDGLVRLQLKRPFGDGTEHDCSTCTAKSQPPTHRSGYRPWRELLMRSFKIDVERCQSCGGRMKLRALVMTSAGILRFLSWLGEPVDTPALAPARDPPYFKSRVIRRRLGAAQVELFDAH